MSFFIPFSSYESRLFLARRLAGIPGYQYDVDMSKEVFQRQIFSPDEAKQLIDNFQKSPGGHEYRKGFVFDAKMYLLEIKRIDDLKNEDEYNEEPLDSMDENRNIFGHFTNLDANNNRNEYSGKWGEDIKGLMDHLELKHPSELLITPVDEENIQMYLNDRKFKELSHRDQLLVKVGIHQAKMIGKRFMRPLYECVLSFYLFMMDQFQKSQK